MTLPSHPDTDSQGSKSRPRLVLSRGESGGAVAPNPPRAVPPDLAQPPSEDSLDVSLGEPVSPTDDTPTIISRQTPAALEADSTGDLSSLALGRSDHVLAPEDGIRGRRLAHFELIEPIGVGGMAAVLRARDTQLDRFVALKILPPEMAADDENVRRFHQEARSAAKLDHENIARVFFCGEDQRLHFIAFEFVEGENLRTLLERRGRIPVGEALLLMIQVAAGLVHASRRGVVHRDIKPSNIIITPDGRAKLVDMGLARCQETRSDNDLTQSGVTLGTFDYISPEQALEPRDADVRSDIYSLGCTLYHMLTGRPPVPEGTAAKKLHYHQHVKPPDPRQFVPDLPLEVVQILDRMMAKQPRDRFSEPEQLVDRLVQAARHLGVSPEVPEGVLIVEGSVPNQPVSRPLLWGALGAVAVVVLVFLLDQAPGGSTVQQGPLSVPEVGDNDGQRKAGRPVVKSVEEAPAVPEDRDTTSDLAVYTSPREPTAQHLLRWLNDHRDAKQIELRLAGDLDLTLPDGSSDTVGLLLGGKQTQKVTIKAKDPGQRPTLRFAWPSLSSTDNENPLVAVAINAKESLVENVRFIVDANQIRGMSMVALLLQGSNHLVRRCEFIQARVSLQEDGGRPAGKGVASVVCERTGPRAEATIADCAFLGFSELAPGDRPSFVRAVPVGAVAGGQDAIVRRGAVRIKADGCVFGPHSAAFRLEQNGSGDEGLLTVRHCSVLVAARRSAVFEVAAGGHGRLDVRQSLFSRMTDEDGKNPPDGAVLLRQADPSTETVVYQGGDNCYHALDGYWTEGGDWQKASWTAYRDKLTGTQDESRLVGVPWKLPRAEQMKALEACNLGAAFAIRLKVKALRLQGRSPTEVVGAETILGQGWLPAALPALDDDKRDPAGWRLLVVEKKGNDSSNDVYPNLAVAVQSARPGDTILLRHNGDLDVESVQLTKKGSDLTVRPARRFRPVLVGQSESEPALFRVHDGKLRLEGLEFRLKPPSKLTMRMVVALVGDGECSLQRCVVTLRQSGDTRGALACLVEAPNVMKPDMLPARSRDQGPKLTLEGCFVRGEGDLLWTRASRPFGLELRKSLVALSGSLVNIEVTADAQPPAETQHTQITLSGVTTWLKNPLVRMSVGTNPRGLVDATCKAKNCLFVPAAPGKPMILLEGTDTEDKSLREKFKWHKEGGPNSYGNFTQLLEQVPSGEEMPLLAKGVTQWKALAGEDNSAFGVQLLKTPPDRTAFSQVEPEQLVPPIDTETDGRGAPPNAVPRPVSASEAEKEP